MCINLFHICYHCPDNIFIVECFFNKVPIIHYFVDCFIISFVSPHRLIGIHFYAQYFSVEFECSVPSQLSLYHSPANELSFVINWSLFTVCSIRFDFIYGVQRHFLQYLSYIVTVSFVCGANRRTRRKPPTWQTLSYNVVQSDLRLLTRYFKTLFF